MSYAERNRAIKKLVAQAFPGHKVRVRGHTGTARGWISINIEYAPRDWREAQELKKLVQQLVVRSGNSPGRFGYDDPGSDYGYGLRMHVNFNQVREQVA